MALNKVTRGEKILQAMADKGVITQTGKDFLIAALDPMHDTQLKELEGWPDVETSSSVVRCLKQTVPIKTPGIGTWDIHIIQWPWLDPQTFYRCGRNPSGNILAQAVAGTCVLGGCQAFAVVSGTPLDVFTATLVGAIYLPTNYSPGATRLIGCGFEAINTTADLYKQGQCTAYRMPQSHFNQSAWRFDLGATSGVFTGRPVRLPPTTTSEATLIPGTRQWLAEEGCYSVSAFVGQDNPPRIVDYNQPLVQHSVFEDATGPGNIGEVLMPVPGAGTPAGSLTWSGQKVFPLHTNGCMFTGLTEQSTFALTTNYYLESFPTPSESEILVLATPSAEYDPKTLEIFSHCLGTLPTAVPAGMNGLGDWFAGLISKASKFISPLLMTAGQPLWAGGAAAAGALADSYLSANTPQTKPSFQKPQQNVPRLQSMSQSTSTNTVKKRKKNKQKQKMIQQQQQGRQNQGQMQKYFAPAR